MAFDVILTAFEMYILQDTDSYDWHGDRYTQRYL